MSLHLNQVGEEEGYFTSERYNCKGGERCVKLLEEYILRHSKAAEQVVITEYMIFDSFFGEEKWAEGFCWFHSQLKGTHKSRAN